MTYCAVSGRHSYDGAVKNITDYSGPSKTGHFFVALDPYIDGVDRFKNRVDEDYQGSSPCRPLTAANYMLGGN